LGERFANFLSVFSVLQSLARFGSLLVFFKMLSVVQRLAVEFSDRDTYTIK
jgi:hypothetical protein